MTQSPSFIKAEAKCREYGATILPETYCGSLQPFSYVCACGSPATTTWANLQKPHIKPHCKACQSSHKKALRRQLAEQQGVLSRIRQRCAQSGSEYVEGSYTNATSPFSFRCKCGELVSGPWQTYQGYSQLVCKPCSNLARSGSNSPTYNPELTEEDRTLRRNHLWYRQWEQAVLKSYGHTCAISGQRGGRLACHHLYNWAKYPDLRREVSNGVVITHELHQEFHNIYGRKHTTREQFCEFFRSKTDKDF